MSIVEEELSRRSPVSIPDVMPGRQSDLQRQWIVEADNDPFQLARSFVEEKARDAAGNLTLRFWRGDWYSYSEGRYVTRRALGVELTGFIKMHFDSHKCLDTFGNARKVGRALVGNTLNALSAIVAVSDDCDMPVWLGEKTQGPFLAVRNGLLDIREILAGKGRVRPSSPLWFSTVAFPLEYDRAATCTRWTQFLREVMEDDQERMDLLQDWAGYLLTPNTSQQKFVVAEGDGANGKSVYFDVLTALLGPENVAHVPLEMFGVRFQLTATLHKLANLCAEVGEIDRAEGHLKQFTASDRMYFDRKNLEGVMAYPTARLMLSSNNRPRFRDRTSGLWRRMILVPFRVTIPPERQDPKLKDTLKEELPGIFLWALEGLKRLHRRGSFHIPPTCKEALEDYRQESNPAKVFLAEHCRDQVGAKIACDVLYRHYGDWSRASGFEALDARQFGKELRKVFPRVERKKGRGPIARGWEYRGLSYQD